MRIWHKELLPYLPLMQIKGQYREVFLVASEIRKKGTPNHILVNRVQEYPLEHLSAYLQMLTAEMERRGLRFDRAKVEALHEFLGKPGEITPSELFAGWHNERYLKQCLYNLQEKADCGRPGAEEWAIIEKAFGRCL
ncbi:MAG: pyrimidine dimer DNA glycosylase/endonuclease V [Acidaminococcaceae bacterium]|nr:pyrimidine dimer DNA glycosylase/endonuclease V [Acidaminococcaceae bacterium]